jgi:hypothetical protein
LRVFLRCNKAGRTVVGGALWRLEKAPGRAGADRMRLGSPVAASLLRVDTSAPYWLYLG